MTLNRLLLLILCCCIGLAKANNNFAIKTVVIDAGHGGRDPGAIGPGHINEKDIALAVALKFGEYLKQTFPDINIIYTRKTDVFLELHDRSDIANQNKADLFICIHCNSTNNSSVYGTSTYVLGLHRTEANLEVAKRENSVINLEDDRDKNYEFDPNSPEGHIIMSMKQNAFLDQSIDIASKIENQFETSAKRKSLGVKQAGFYVIYKTTMPSLLSEIGFISNPTEEKFLNSEKGQDQVAQSLLRAFKDYKMEMEHGESDQYVGVSGGGKTKAEPGNDVTSSTANTKQSEKNGSSAGSNQGSGNPKTETVVIRDDQPVASAGKTKTPETPKNSNAQNGDDAAYYTLQNGKKIKRPIETSSGGGNAPADKQPVTKIPEKEPSTASKEPGNSKKDTPASTSKNDVVVKDVPKSKDDTKSTSSASKSKDAANAKGDNTSSVAPKNDIVVHVVPKSTENPKSASSASKSADKPATPKETIEASSSPSPSKKVESDKPKSTEIITDKPAPKTSPSPKISDKPASLATKESSTKEVDNGLIFKVQLFALKTDMKKSDRAVLTKLYSDLSTEELPSGVIRYYAGKSSTYSEAKKDLNTATSHGYKDAFIVGFKNGVRMTPAQIKAAETH